MKRIKWYGPSLLLIAASVLVMFVGPEAARQIAWAQSDAKIKLIKEGLAKNSTLAELSAAFRGVAQAVEPSVVHIQVSARQHVSARSRVSPAIPGSPEDDMLRRFFGPRAGPMVPREDDQQDEDKAAPPADQGVEKYNVPRPYGSGSGWVYDDKGHIITNNHVIDGADEIKVKFTDGSERTAKVVGTDPKTDVAVLQVEGGGLHPASTATEPSEQGDIVFAFGSPFRFEFSVSQGIVSAKGRDLQIIGEGGYENFIQTDAAINPGNSGGPLCNIEGQVIGMNTAIASQTGAYNGLGFAIPIDMARDVIQQILTRGKVVRGYLGISIGDNLTPAMAETFGFKGQGVLVLSALEDGPAAKAGVKDGDIITKVSGKVVTTPSGLRLLVADIAPNTKVPLEIFRDGKTINIEVTVAEQPANMSIAAATPSNEATPKPDDKGAQLLRELGFESLATMTPELADQLRFPKFFPGVIIRSIRPDSVAASVRLSPRQVIVAVMNTPVKTVEEFTAAINKSDLNKGVRIRVIHEGMARYELLKLDTAK